MVMPHDALGKKGVITMTTITVNDEIDWKSHLGSYLLSYRQQNTTFTCLFVVKGTFHRRSIPDIYSCFSFRRLIRVTIRVFSIEVFVEVVIFLWLWPEKQVSSSLRMHHIPQLLLLLSSYLGTPNSSGFCSHSLQIDIKSPWKFR